MKKIFKNKKGAPMVEYILLIALAIGVAAGVGIFVNNIIKNSQEQTCVDTGGTWDETNDTCTPAPAVASITLPDGNVVNI